MSMILIKGTYRILNTAPDGDSIRFYPHNPELWKKLPRRVRSNFAGGAQLRLDSIDALETHYQPQGNITGMVNQPLEYAHAATDELLKFVGFQDFTRNNREVITAVSPEQVPGYILTRSADVYGRCVAFVFAGDIDREDGDSIFFDGELLQKSANYHLIETGLTYPTFYSKLYPDIRKELIISTQTARQAGKGLWSLDQTTIGFELENLQTLTEQVVILPKLFRRLFSYLAINDGSYSLDGFIDFLESQNDRLIILPEGHVTGFDFVVTVESQRVKMNYSPEDLVFMEK